MVDDAFRTIVNLMTRFVRAQAVVDVLPPIPKGHIESTELLPGSTSKEGAGGRHYLESPGYGRRGTVGRKPGIDVVGEEIEADHHAGVLNRVVREEKLGPDHRRGWVLDGMVHECREPACSRNG